MLPATRAGDLETLQGVGGQGGGVTKCYRVLRVQAKKRAYAFRFVQGSSLSGTRCNLSTSPTILMVYP